MIGLFCKYRFAEVNNTIAINKKIEDVIQYLFFPLTALYKDIAVKIHKIYRIIKAFQYSNIGLLTRRDIM